MRSKPLIIVLILVCPTISACGGSLVAPVSAPQNLGLTHDAALASETERPFAYVAETCQPTLSCPSPNGFVQMLGRPAITAGVKNPTTLSLVTRLRMITP